MRLCRQSNTIPIYLPDLTYILPVISYHPSLSYICPSLYLDPIGPPTMITTHVCKVRLDHFKVNWVEGRFQVNEWVQDYSWKGLMVVIQFTAENRRELVAECMGWAELGRQITRFLIVEKSWVDRSYNLVVNSWRSIWHWRLPNTLDSEWYLPREGDGNSLPLPHFSKPLPDRFTSFSESTGDVLGCNSLLQFLLYY